MALANTKDFREAAKEVALEAGVSLLGIAGVKDLEGTKDRLAEFGNGSRGFASIKVERGFAEVRINLTEAYDDTIEDRDEPNVLWETRVIRVSVDLNIGHTISLAQAVTANALFREVIERMAQVQALIDALPTLVIRHQLART